MTLSDLSGLWDNIDSLENKGLYKSAYDQVNVLSSQADSANDNINQLKATIYRAKYAAKLNENTHKEAIAIIEKKLSQETDVVNRSIYQSLLGELYYLYASKHQFKIRGRTQGQDNTQDIDEWSLRKIINVSNDYYLSSTESPESKGYSLSGINELIIDQGKETIGFDLYAVLLKRSVDHFSTRHSLLTDATNAFILYDEVAFADLNNFINHNFETSDEGSYSSKALILYQKLIEHLTDDWQAKVDLDRLQYVHKIFRGTDSETLYINALQRIARNTNNIEVKNISKIKLAELYKNKGNRYGQHFEKEYKSYLAKAHTIVNEVIIEAKTEAVVNSATQLKLEIESQQLVVSTEQVILPNEPFLIHVEFRNIEKVVFRLIDANETLKDKINYAKNNDAINKLLIAENAIREWSEDTGADDFNLHATELKIKPLPLGEYYIHASSDGMSSFQLLRISNLSYFVDREENYALYTVTDRREGHTISDVKLSVFRQDYKNRIRNRPTKVLIDSGLTDRNGQYRRQINDQESETVILQKDNDVLDLNAYQNFYQRHRRQARDIVHIFTDRNLYRPGQKVYVKAIVLQADAYANPLKVSANTSVELICRNANGKEVFKSEFSTNEYGSISEEFDLPPSGLAGQYGIEIRSGSGNAYQPIQVEEYKRPKFYVDLQVPKIEYALGDDVIVKGNVSMFSGNAVDGAKLTFRVTRSVAHVYWRHYSRSYPVRETAEIAFGSLVADANGEFQIDFNLAEDKSTHKQSIHNYTVYVDATDVSGETQSTIEIIRASKNSAFISLSHTGKIDKSKLDSLSIFSKNINGEDIPFSGRVQIEKLVEPDRFKRSKYWSRLDTMILSEEEFNDLPHDYIHNKSSTENWEVENIIYDSNFKSDGKYTLSLSKFIDAGVYKVSIFNDNNEELVEYISIVDVTKNQFNKSELFHYATDKDIYEPGETIELNIGSEVNNLYVLYQLEKDEKIVDRKWLNASGRSTIKIPVAEKDRGGFVIHLTAVNQNRLYRHTVQIDVPWTNKALHLNTSTFRSTLEPGATEKWTVEISDPNNKAIQAELIAAMYDASLDALYTEHQWQPFTFNNYRSRLANRVFGFQLQRLRQLTYPSRKNIGRGIKAFRYPDLQFFGLMAILNQGRRGTELMDEGVRSRSMKSMPATEMAGAVAEQSVEADTDNESAENVDDLRLSENAEFDWSQIRKNLEETVFFFPDLVSKRDGKIRLDFTMSEALTKWKLLLFAHDKQARYAHEVFHIETKKDIMLFPNVPRFVREGDKIKLSGKVSNVSERDIVGTVRILLQRPISEMDVTDDIVQSPATYPINIKAGQSESIEWDIEVDDKYMDGLIYKMYFQSDNHSDGEEGFIPVLTNKLLVTESLPFYTKGQSRKDYNFDRLHVALNKSSAKPLQYSIEYVSNPSWYAIQALPYLTEKRYESSEQIFNRFFANTIGRHISTSDPLIHKTLTYWQQTNSEELKSNLQKNQDLKLANLEDTPWLRQAENEAEQKRAVSSFFDENKLSGHITSSIDKLIQLQNNDGGFSWCPRGRSSLFISAQILEGIGKLEHLGISHTFPQHNINKLIQFIDSGINELAKENQREFGTSFLYLLYARSFYANSNPIEIKVEKLLDKSMIDWNKRNPYDLGLMCIVLHRYDRVAESNAILNSIKEQMVRSDELGTFWPQGDTYNANHSAIDKQVRMIELFVEMEEEQDLIDELRIWLLRNKQTNHWKSTRSTSAAVYALLLQTGNQEHSKWLNNSQDVIVEAAGEKLFESDEIEKGTLYSRQNWSGSEIKAELAEVSINNPNDQVSWGAAYLQYFDDIDKVSGNDISGLSITKEMYKKVNSSSGPKLEQIKGGTLLAVGDKLVVKLICKADRTLEYVHLKDMRAAGTEPEDVISQRKWQDGLSYYQTTQDLSTNFFIDFMQKGTFVMEYELRVNLPGSYSSGMASLQCAYAPEFVAHSNSVNLELE